MFAHETGHLLGMDHTFDTNGQRNWKCNGALVMSYDWVSNTDNNMLSKNVYKNDMIFIIFIFDIYEHIKMTSYFSPSLNKIRGQIALTPISRIMLLAKVKYKEAGFVHKVIHI